MAFQCSKRVIPSEKKDGLVISVGLAAALEANISSYMIDGRSASIVYHSLHSISLWPLTQGFIGLHCTHVCCSVRYADGLQEAVWSVSGHLGHCLVLLHQTERVEEARNQVDGG